MEWVSKFKDFTTECIRVIRITKRPDKEEYMNLVKVSGLGILLIGLVGFILHILNQLFFSGVFK